MASEKKKRKKKRDPQKSIDDKAHEAEHQQGAKLTRLFVLFFALLLAGGSIAFFIYYPDVHGPGPGLPVRLVFTGKEPASKITERLVESGLVRDPRLFSAYFRVQGGWVAPGPHLLPDDLTPRELIARLQRKGSPAKVTFPEGWTRFDMAKRLEKLEVCDLHAFLEATTNKTLLAELHIDGDSAEGFLFPATYDLPKDSDPQEIVRTLVKQLDKRWATLTTEHGKGLRELQDAMGWSKRQILALASMIEKEAALDEERPIIASVFLNRLRDPAFTPKLLQCDPTAAYGCLVSDAPTCIGYAYGTKITHEMLADAKNPYNTYKHEGLPPGPIANPGAKSIEAVLAPQTTKYLYFVARGGGHHTFSETYGEHQAALQKP